MSQLQMFENDSKVALASIRITDTIYHNYTLLHTYLDDLRINHIKSINIYKSSVLKFYRFLCLHFQISLENIEEALIDLQLKTVHQYKKYLQLEVSNNRMSVYTYTNQISLIKKYWFFLHNRKIIDFQISSNFNKSKNNNIPAVIKSFIQDLIQKNKRIPEHRKFVMNFYRHICSINSTQEYDFKTLSQFEIRSYEEYIAKRVLREELTRPSAYNMLNSVKIFLAFLKQINIVSIDYNIAQHLIARSEALNLYVETKDIKSLIHTIVLQSRDKSRDIAIVLLLIDTGCRPIEIANLTIEDISLSESTITFICNKSIQRKLKLNKFVRDQLNVYIKERNKMKLDHNYVFITRSNKPISSDRVSNIIRAFNYASFGEIRFSAYALRHTYATNALNNNDLAEVASAMGHRKWKSTIHYKHKSKKRLLTNTLPYNPFKN